jgi:hypothetical protein
MQLLPAPNRIPLNDVDVPDKRLRRSKKRQHPANCPRIRGSDNDATPTVIRLLL